MEKIIEVHWQNEYDETVYGDAIIEFARYDEDGKVVNEITKVFLPNYGPLNIYIAKGLRQQAIDSFHNGEGYNL